MAGKLAPRQWQGCTPTVDFMPPYTPPPRVLRSTLVSWRPPDDGWIKLNTDGSSLPLRTGLPRLWQGGGVVRGPDGDILTAFCVPLSASSSFEAELLALLQGLSLAADYASRIWIELDSAAVVAVLSAGHLGAADVRHPMVRIRALLRHLDVRFSHIYREGNRVADFLAGRGAQTSALEIFDSASAPLRAQALARMDQLGYPNWRFRYRDG